MSLDKLVSFRALSGSKAIAREYWIPSRWLSLDASSITGLVDNDPVASWTDDDGGEVFSQGTAANQPTYKTNVQNGLPAVRFDGSGDHLDGSIRRRLVPCTIVAVASSDDVTNVGMLVGNNGGNGSLLLRNRVSQWEVDREGLATFANSTTTLNTGTVYIVTFRIAEDGAWDFRLNGSPDGSGTYSDALLITTNPVCIGARDSGTSYWDGDVFEIGIYRDVLEDRVVGYVEDLLAAKWGL